MPLRLFQTLVVAFFLLVGLLGFSLYQSLTNARAQITSPVVSVPHSLESISFGSSRGGVITANPYTQQIFAAQEDVPALADIDAHANEITAEIPLRGYHTGLTIDYVKNEIYVAQEFSQTIRVIDGATNKMTRELAVPGGSPIGALAFDSNDNRLFVIQNDIKTIAILDFLDGTLLGTLPIDAHYGDLALDAQTHRLYVSSPLENKITVVDTTNTTILATISVGKNPKGIAVNPVTKKVYVALADDHLVGVIDAVTDKLLTTLPVGGSPGYLAVNPLTNRIYASILETKQLIIIDGTSERIVAEVALDATPGPLAVLPDLQRVYVSTDQGHGVFVIQDVLPTDANPIAVVSDENLRALTVDSSALPTDWNQPEFDDETWQLAARTNCVGRDPMPPYPDAVWVWFPGCTQHKQSLLFRKTFELPQTGFQGVLRLRATDEAEVFVNGQRVGATELWTTASWHNLSPFLRPGKNVLAIRARNDQGGYGMLLFRGDFHSPQ